VPATEEWEGSILASGTPGERWRPGEKGGGKITELRSLKKRQVGSVAQDAVDGLDALWISEASIDFEVVLGLDEGAVK
jgi:hypothetical protein